MTRQAERVVHQCPSAVELSLYKALSERRYTPYFGFYRFTDSLYKFVGAVPGADMPLPLQWRLPF